MAFLVLRPVCALVGSDSLPSNDVHHFHVDDTYNPLEPGALLSRLQTIGFARVTITVDWSVKTPKFIISNGPLARRPRAGQCVTGSRPGSKS